MLLSIILAILAFGLIILVHELGHFLTARHFGVTIDEFSNFNGKKIIYLTDKNDFNKNVNKKIYNKFDYIIVSNKQVLEHVQEYCKNNVMLIENINDLNAFNIF